MVRTASELTSRAAAAVMAELASEGLPTRSDRDEGRLRLVRLRELHSSARWGACTLATDIVDGTFRKRGKLAGTCVVVAPMLKQVVERLSTAVGVRKTIPPAAAPAISPPEKSGSSESKATLSSHSDTTAPDGCWPPSPCDFILTDDFSRIRWHSIGYFYQQMIVGRGLQHRRAW
uniref:(northern house mosquito) hypothetical protein n=1 Tax=Culex pipiens TaxID=7175 RepID=A0A8D8MCI0_CULPI